jgi:hypothetical protein
MLDNNYRWHEVKFKFKMLDQNHRHFAIHKADSPIHSMIANEIFRPIIQDHSERICVWRFHRVFNPQNDCHYCRLKFYGKQALDTPITSYLSSHALYQEIKALDLLKLGQDENITCVALNEPNLKDDCDPNWSEEIKEVWPYYIHGASRAWLKMIEIFAERESQTLPYSTFEEKITLYTRVNQLVEEKWVGEGKHAMLHHLNAVFGYKFINVALQWFEFSDINPVMLQLGKKQVPGYHGKIRF